MLPKAKAKGHAGKNGKSDGANDRGKSPSGNKENPCWYHFKAEKGCLKGNECTFSHSKKTEHKLRKLPKGNWEGEVQIQIIITEEGRWSTLCVPEGKV